MLAVLGSRKANIDDVADHIMYLGNLIGFEHVGMGIDPAPEGLEDVSKYGALMVVLLRWGLSVADLKGVTEGNILRVIAVVEQLARDMADETPFEDQVQLMFESISRDDTEVGNFRWLPGAVKLQGSRDIEAPGGSWTIVDICSMEDLQEKVPSKLLSTAWYWPCNFIEQWAGKPVNTFADGTASNSRKRPLFFGRHWFQQ